MLLFPNVLKNHTSLHCSRDAKVLLYMLYITTKFAITNKITFLKKGIKKRQV